jgi:hypothetical protein
MMANNTQSTSDHVNGAAGPQGELHRREATESPGRSCEKRENGHATIRKARSRVDGPFDQVSDQLVCNGYSPVALVRKRPIDDGWQRWCQAAPTAAEAEARKGQGFNVGVAMGYGHVVGIDIDTEDPAIIATIRVAGIPVSNVAKFGQKGRTDFYNIGMPTPTRRFFGKDGKIIVELQAAGAQSVVPPSQHPDTGKPYTWLTLRTLLDIRVDELTEAPADIAQRLEKALAPWLKDEQPNEGPKRTGPLPVLTEPMRHRAWAMAGLHKELAALAAKQKPGRNRAMFALVCKFGRFFHHGVITDAELIAAVLQACDANGLNKDNGRHDTERAIDRALRYALNDVLEDRPSRELNAKARKKKVGPKRAGLPPPAKSLPAINWPDLTGKSRQRKPDSRSQANVKAYFAARGVTLAFNTFSLRNEIALDGLTTEFDDAKLHQIWLDADAHGLRRMRKEFFCEVCYDVARPAICSPTTIPSRRRGSRTAKSNRAIIVRRRAANGAASVRMCPVTRLSSSSDIRLREEARLA